MARRSEVHKGATVSTVLEHLGPLVLDHDGNANREDGPVSDVVIDDGDLGTPIPSGAVVLGVGVTTADAVDELLARSDAAGAAAVIVKHRPDRPDRPPRPHGAVLVEVASDLTWAQLHVFVRTALLHVGDAGVGAHTLFDVANAIALRVDGAVVIEDEHLRVLAYSSLEHQIDDARRATILGRQIPERYVGELRERGVTEHLAASSEPVRFDLAGPGMLPRLVVALRAEGRMIGLLWAITDDEREATARRVLADAAPDVAIELRRHLTADTSLASDRRAAARRLLDGQPVRAAADLFGAAPANGFVTLVLRPDPRHVAAPDSDAMARTAQLATVYVDAYRVPALVAPVTGPNVEIVVGLTAMTGPGRARTLLDELATRTRATFGIDVWGAMGTVVTDPRELPRSRRDALAVLDLLVARGDAACASYEEVHNEVARQELLHLAESGEHLTRGPVINLAAAPDRTTASLVTTIRAFLAAGGDVTRTAADLGVHRNTVRYRVQRFETLTGTDLGDPVQRLVAEVQLQLVAVPS